MGGGKSDGIYAVVDWGWNEEPSYETPVRWHTEDADTDPWEWRIRVLAERDDIAYGKLFFKKSGYITKEWYPYFLAARRGDTSFEEAYESGKMSHFAKRIYGVILANKSLPTEEIKRLGGFSKEDKARFDAAICDLQMKMFLTTDGKKNRRKISGEEYGWASVTYCTTELFWEHTDVFEIAKKITKEEAIEKISNQVLKLNPVADEKKIRKFIT